MRLAYADPPYFGCCGLYKHHHPDGRCWNDPETHLLLIEQLNDEFPDGWALSASSSSLQFLLSLSPQDVRIAAWVKPGIGGPGCGVIYSWEPVIFRGGRKSPKDPDRPFIARDFLSQSVTDPRGLAIVGGKPPAFNRWILLLLGFNEAIDSLTDLFPGSGSMAKTLQQGTLEVTS